MDDWRGAKRALQRWLGLEEPVVDEQHLVDELHRWILGLPFVEELRSVPSAPKIRRFGVNCPPLGTQAVLLLTGPFAEDDDDPNDLVTAVLPRLVARGIASRESLGPDLPGDRCLVAMRSPASSDELLGLEDVLLTAYLAVFEEGE